MAKLAFLGLGQMGLPMARRLITAGHDVTVWNRTPEKAEPLVAEGGRQAFTPAEAANGAEAAVTMLADPEAFEAVLFGSDGLAEAMQDGATLIDMSTVGPDAVRKAGGRLPPGVAMLDAPVLGTVPHAEQGDLKIFVGGDIEAYDRWREVLEVLGTPRLVGSLGAGAAVKLVVNSAIGAVVSAIGESLALADALALDERTTLDVLEDSIVGPGVARARASIESGVYPPRFKLSLARKDLGLVTDAATRAGLKLRVAPAAREWMESAVDGGLGGLDYTAVVAHIRDREARPS
jgi:3-hydroxyisobutyrate dehydrogenase-like beta-hydroxyacid dehydrogenase